MRTRPCNLAVRCGLAAFLPLLLTGAAVAGVNGWTVNGPPGQDVLSVVIAASDPSTIYAGTRSGGLFKSENGGGSWSLTALTSSDVSVLAVDPTTASTVYAGAGISLSKSMNGGASWTSLPIFSAGTVVIDPLTPSTLYAAGNVGVSKSIDGGATWNPSSVGLGGDGAGGLAIDPNTPSTLYVSMFPLVLGGRPAASAARASSPNGGIFKSLDGGAHWNVVEPNRTSVTVLAVDSATPSTVYAVDTYVYKTIDGGANWNKVDGNPGAVVALAIDPLTPSTIYVYAYVNGIYKSLDGGGSFDRLPVELTDLTFVRAFAVNSASPSTLYAAVGPGGVIQSTNGGGRWSTANNGLIASSVARVAVAPAAAGVPPKVYAGTENQRMFLGVDGGGWWRSASNGLLETDVVALSIDPTISSTLFEAGAYFGANKSTDGGDTWAPINNGLDGFPRVRAFAIDPALPSTVYAGTGLGVYKSINGGGDWTSTMPSTFFDISAMVIDPKTPATIYAGTGYDSFSSYSSGGVCRSDDGGGKWTFSNTGFPDQESIGALAIDPATPAILYAGTSSGIYKSTDSGANWSAASNGFPAGIGAFSLVVDPLAPATIYAAAWQPSSGVGGAGVFRSVDGGGNWSPLNVGLTNFNVACLAIDASGSTLRAATRGGGVFDYEIVADPAVAKITPAAGPASGGTALTISGSGFDAGATVRIGVADAADVVVVDDKTITGKSPALAPGSPGDVVVQNPGASTGTLEDGWFAEFADVPPASLYASALARIRRAGITKGCGSGNACPDDPVTRSQMAAFILRGRNGSAYKPPPPSGTVFPDVTQTTPFADWIEQFAAEGMTKGCAGGKFCPNDPVTRGEMAVFLLRGKWGGAYKPPAPAQIFADVPVSNLFSRWITELSSEGITAGCGGDNFCPDLAVTRGQMAAFLARAFGLP